MRTRNRGTRGAKGDARLPGAGAIVVVVGEDESDAKRLRTKLSRFGVLMLVLVRRCCRCLGWDRGRVRGRTSRQSEEGNQERDG